MFLKKRKILQSPTRLIIKLLNRLYELNGQTDLHPIIYDLKKKGYKLESINPYPYNVSGQFTKEGFSYEISIPYFKINEDILNQLKSMLQEYFQYLSESMGNDYKEKYAFNIDSEKIDWNEVYGSSIYAKFSLETTIELLYERFYEYLTNSKTEII